MFDAIGVLIALIESSLGFGIFYIFLMFIWLIGLITSAVDLRLSALLTFSLNALAIIFIYSGLQAGTVNEGEIYWSIASLISSIIYLSFSYAVALKSKATMI